MMKNIIRILLVCSVSLGAAAQEGEVPKPKKKSTFLLNLGTDIHLNNADISNEMRAVYEPMSTSNSAGTRVGLEYNIQSPSRFIFSVGVDYRHVAQRVRVDYKAKEIGFYNTDVSYTQEWQFDMHNIDPYMRIGYAVPLKRETQAIEWSFGVITSILVTKSEREVETVALNITDDTYKDVVLNYDAQWGSFSTDAKIPANPLITMQVAYKANLSGKSFKAGVDFKRGTNVFNMTEVYYFGQGRNYEGRSVFADRFLSIGIFVGVGM